MSDQITTLPTEALPHLAEVLATLELTPWNGKPHHEDNSTGAVRHWTFGPHHAGHLIRDDQHEVHLLLIQWLDTTP
ncbi:hypothetical protein [Actinophytocola sp.]|uniref:hypothetical protein n=1 Tax=Actinophytocola sp. TaxID=1872138 RepID=UPI00389A8C8B